jgi:hypothetical protein
VRPAPRHACDHPLAEVEQLVDLVVPVGEGSVDRGDVALERGATLDRSQRPAKDQILREDLVRDLEVPFVPELVVEPPNERGTLPGLVVVDVDEEVLRVAATPHGVRDSS